VTTLWRIATSWILPAVAGLLFIAVGLVKFVGPAWPANFARWGYPAYAYAVVGIVEVAGGLALLVPRFRVYAAVGLATVMVGAIATAALHGEPRFVRTASIYLLMVVAILATSRRGGRQR